MHAYRFVFPTLLVGSEMGRELYLFDIPSATLIQIISLTSYPPVYNSISFGINYVELGARHAFVCTNQGLLIAPRENIAQNPIQALLSLDSTQNPEFARGTAYQTKVHDPYDGNPAMRFITLKSKPQTSRSTELVRLIDYTEIFTAGMAHVITAVIRVATYTGYMTPQFMSPHQGATLQRLIGMGLSSWSEILNVYSGRKRLSLRSLFGSTWYPLQ